MLTTIAIVSVAFTLTACNQEPNLSPTDTYLQYHDNSKSNNNFETEASYYTSEKTEAVNAKLKDYQKHWNMNSIADVKTKYMGFVMNTSKCMSLTPVDENISGNTATLLFSVVDECSGHEGAKQKVVMKKQDGWKIEDTETIL